MLHGRDATSIAVGGKAEELLCQLALRYDRPVPREYLLEALWPGTNPTLAGQSFNSLISILRKLCKDALAGAPPLLHAGKQYQLNLEAGVNVDVALFDQLAEAGERASRAGHVEEAVEAYRRALALYRGDLCLVPDAQAIIERERLRARYLTLLVRLASYEYEAGRYAASLRYGQRLLVLDPYREDAHRLVMRCYVQLGERAQALRQFRLCHQLLQAEFEAEPESATLHLFEQIRRDPTSL